MIDDGEQIRITVFTVLGGLSLARGFRTTYGIRTRRSSRRVGVCAFRARGVDLRIRYCCIRAYANKIYYNVMILSSRAVFPQDEKSEIAVARNIFYDTTTAILYTDDRRGPCDGIRAPARNNRSFLSRHYRELHVVVPRVRPSYPSPTRPTARRNLPRSCKSPLRPISSARRPGRGDWLSCKKTKPPNAICSVVVVVVFFFSLSECRTLVKSHEKYPGKVL